jgi:cytochrome b6-f complex iron-sulfur subunit
MVSLPMACGGGDAGGLSSGPIVYGNVSAVPVGSLLPLPRDPGLLGRDSGGLYALSAICTHMGCLVPPPPTMVAMTMTCPCHGSEYDRNGAVVKGPAPSPLQHYQVDLAADGTITIQGNKPVASTFRTAVA